METKNVIERLEKLKSLVTEYQISRQAESYDYVMKYEYQAMGLQYYSLCERQTNDVKIDTYDRLLSWLKLRNVEKVKIYLVPNT